MVDGKGEGGGWVTGCDLGEHGDGDVVCCEEGGVAGVRGELLEVEGWTVVTIST